MLDTSIKLRIIELRASGKSIAAIAKTVSVAKQTVIDVTKEAAEEVATLQAVELEALYEAEKVSCTERVKSLSYLFKRLRKELEQRDLESLPTDKLVDLYLRTASALEETVLKPVFKSTKELEEQKQIESAISALL